MTQGGSMRVNSRTSVGLIREEEGPSSGVALL